MSGISISTSVFITTKIRKIINIYKFNCLNQDLQDIRICRMVLLAGFVNRGIDCREDVVRGLRPTGGGYGSRYKRRYV